MTQDAPEVRNQTIGASVTPTEKRYAELAATVAGKPLSQLLREVALDELIERGRGFAERLRSEAKQAAAA